MAIENPIHDANWQVHWTLTESAGVRIYLADFRGRRFLWEATMPYVTIDHQRQDVGPEDESQETHGPWWVPLGRRSSAGWTPSSPGGSAKISQPSSASTFFQPSTSRKNARVASASSA